MASPAVDELHASELPDFLQPCELRGLGDIVYLLRKLDFVIDVVWLNERPFLGASLGSLGVSMHF